MRPASVLLVARALNVAAAPALPGHRSVLVTEFIADPSPTPQCPASTIVETPGGLVSAWLDRIFTSESKDDGATWAPLSLLDVRNPNSGIDAVTLADGRFLLVYNDAQSVEGNWSAGRGLLRVAVSSDGTTWKPVLTLEDQPGQEFSYPAVIQTDDGCVHVTYTWKRQKIRHVVLDSRLLR
jgi:predicted neuraminidase